MNKLLRAMWFLRLTDDSGRLSLTNIALIMVTANLLTCSSAGTMDVLSFLVTVLGYQAKRFMSNSSADPAQETDELKKAIADLQAKVAGLHMGKPFQR